MKKLWDLKKVFSNLDLEGQGSGIIMGVTRLLLLGPFYTIQTKKDQTFWRGVYVLIPMFFSRLKEGSLNRIESSATTILLEMFSGFEYVSHSTNMDSKPNYWYISQTLNSGLTLHVNKVFFFLCQLSSTYISKTNLLNWNQMFSNAMDNILKFNCPFFYIPLFKDF